MINIHKNAFDTAEKYGMSEHVAGANIAGFLKVAEATMAWESRIVFVFDFLFGKRS